jgi:hypothetical protein
MHNDPPMISEGRLMSEQAALLLLRSSALPYAPFASIGRSLAFRASSFSGSERWSP